MTKESAIKIEDITKNARLREAAEIVVITSLNLCWTPVMPDDDLFSDRSLVLGAIEGDELIGVCASTFRPEHTLSIDELAVSSHRRKCGIGSQLLGKTEAVGRRLGITEIRLISSVNALGFYASRDYLARHDKYVFTKSLDCSEDLLASD